MGICPNLEGLRRKEGLAGIYPSNQGHQSCHAFCRRIETVTNVGAL